jgi:DnaJ family protein B protein 13
MVNTDLKKVSLMKKAVKNLRLFNFFCAEIVGGYRFAGNSYEIYDKFFGSTNPFVDKLEDDSRDQFGSMFGGAFGG